MHADVEGSAKQQREVASISDGHRCENRLNLVFEYVFDDAGLFFCQRGCRDSFDSAGGELWFNVFQETLVLSVGHGMNGLADCFKLLMNRKACRIQLVRSTLQRR